MSTHDTSVNKVLDMYDLQVQDLMDRVTGINTGDPVQDVELLKSWIVQFCEDWMDYSGSYKEAKELDLKLLQSIIEEFNRNVESSYKSIALVRTFKKDRHGVNSPCYKDVDLNSLISDYKSGISTKELGLKYSLTVPTVINRLKSAGVYKDGRHK